ncbi:MAG: DUF3373 family protein [Desulfobacterales bacterium]|jgi:hypothetical protein|nr:DUF3373 family protein [Desulfobacteraceae bacterium]MBT7086480.1 DUF3373 family protein [Desulfobacterales bacterium]MBT7697867.1 DUF3373 family protein [Desulfobacterales bacterium]
MKDKIGLRGKCLLFISCVFFLVIFLSPISALANSEVDDLKEKLKTLEMQIKKMEERLNTTEKSTATEEKQIQEIEDRLNKTELHSATDKISLGIEFRTRGDSIHYNDIRIAPGWLMNGFFTDVGINPMTMAPWTVADMNSTTPASMLMMLGMMPPGMTVQQMISMNGFNGATKTYIQSMMAAMAAAGAIPDAEKYDADNDTIFTNKFHMNMKAKVSDNLSFAGRLAMYKVFGDSAGVKFNTGSFGDIFLDGNTSSLPHGDTIHLERAYFNYKSDIGDIPTSFSLGRRPATLGAPLEYRNNSLEGGSPLATIINWQFDGASYSLNLEDTLDIPGAAFKLCYGVGFESDWGNSYSLNATSAVDDATFGGFIATLYDDDLTSVVVNYAHAWDITDGFVGTMLMPFIPFEESDGTYSFTKNRGGYISRMEASTNIGDFDMFTILLRTNLSEIFSDIDIFFAPSWSKTSPAAISRNPFYSLLGQGLLSSNGQLEGHDGYSVYMGAIFPMPFGGKLGLEYNWGSKYWINMTGAEDSLIASKLSTRGQVFEGYYIQPVVGDKFFVTLGGQYYDYKYTGSGNPLGAPVEVSNVNAFDAFFPVLDKVWNLYMSATLRF